MRKFLKSLAVAAMFGIAFLTGVTTHAADGNVVLVLDPGHDSHDAGARRTWNGITYAEETITLKMAQYCKEELDKYSGISVYLTRTTNAVDMDRYDRVKVAKDLGADALVSLHINSTGNYQDSISGALAYVPTYSNRAAYANEARALAQDIVENLSTVGMKNLGYLKNEELGIIYYGKQWKIPTMIIEHGFVNNPSDCRKYYGSNAKIRAVAVADARAIAKHYGLNRKAGWQQSGNNMIYLDENGKMVTGWLTDAGKQYYLDENGHKVSGFVKIKGKKYYFNSDGTAFKGLLRIGSDLYSVKNGGEVRTGWCKAGSRQYYATKSGKLRKGFQTYKKQKYYFSPETGVALKGMQQIGKRFYYFDAKGRMQTGWVQIGKAEYYFKKSTGVRKTGWFKYRGKYYYLNPQTGIKMKNRWVCYQNQYYYVDRKGARLQNTKKVIGGVTYKFERNGVCKKKTKTENKKQALQDSMQETTAETVKETATETEQK